MSYNSALIVFGLALEGAGLALVSAEDLAPWMRRGRALVANARDRLVANLQRILRRTRRVGGSVKLSSRATIRARGEAIRTGR